MMDWFFYSRAGPLFLVLLHRRRVGGPPGTNVPAIIPDLQDDSRGRGREGKRPWSLGRTETGAER